LRALLNSGFDMWIASGEPFEWEGVVAGKQSATANKKGPQDEPTGLLLLCLLRLPLIRADAES